VLPPLPTSEGKTAAEVRLWILQIVTAALFFMAAYPKFTSDPKMVWAFEQIGVGQWFRILTGSLEARHSPSPSWAEAPSMQSNTGHFSRQ
jgi:hypothetical protein